MGKRVLLCAEWYAPSVGGVQKVVRELGEGLVRRGHDVTVATTSIDGRPGTLPGGVAVRGFDVSGNLVLGVRGEAEEYRQFVLDGGFDALLVYAAQQWTFDALWPILPQVQARKIHVPCGYSCLYEPSYEDYFRRMPDILRQFDHLVFNATDYRDIQFARENGLERFSVLPNGASEREFAVSPVPDLRQRLGIAPEAFVLLSVGSPPFAKGHAEVAQAYARASFPFPTCLVLDGRYERRYHPPAQNRRDRVRLHLRGVLKRILRGQENPAQQLLLACQSIRRQRGKQVVFTDLPREEMVAAFFAADLFVFASRVEYSPLVLFEAAAAGLPFLTVPAGNADEIARWTGAGEIVPAERDRVGNTRVSVDVLSQAMADLATDRERLGMLGRRGRENWKRNYTWETIVGRYEELLCPGGPGRL
ncbi:MAG: glycosyltransferase family 4 protein [Syntrophaceae bacterium]|nr:glycosyltransferase family 4 protein [Syntrophaceae bacterium]